MSLVDTKAARALAKRAAKLQSYVDAGSLNAYDATFFGDARDTIRALADEVDRGNNVAEQLSEKLTAAEATITSLRAQLAAMTAERDAVREHERRALEFVRCNTEPDNLGVTMAQVNEAVRAYQREAQW